MITPGASAAVAHHLVPSLVGSPDAPERPITVDQTNQSVIVDEALVVKWLRPPVAPPHRGATLMAHLMEVGFVDMPAYHGAYVADGLVAAVITSYLPGALDGWDWYVDLVTEELSHGHPARAVSAAARLGTMATHLHVALATRSSVVPIPAGWADGAAEHARATALLADAMALTDGPAGGRLAVRVHRIRAALDTLALAGSLEVQHIHGDLHVGNVLARGDTFVVTDFDGDPVTAPGPDTLRSPMVDLASLVQSVDHVGRIVAKRRPDLAPAVDDFIADATATLLGTYGKGSPIDHGVLTALRTVQELHEFVYAAKHLPRWQYVPDAALVALYP